MNQTLRPFITQQGIEAVLNSSSDGVAAKKIIQIGLGGSDNKDEKGYAVVTNDKNYATQTALLHEQERVDIVDGRRAGPEQIDLSFIADSDKEYYVRELGFYLEDGTLFAVWSSPEHDLAWKAQNVPLIIGLELVLSALPADAVTVEPGSTPLQLTITREMTALSEAIIRLQTEQLEQRKALNTNPPTGTIITFGAKTPPEGWLECDGAALSRTTYAKLFEVIGTLHGHGDGITTFNLPDLRGEFVRGWDHGRGIDEGRGFGAWQEDEIVNHDHYLKQTGDRAIGHTRGDVQGPSQYQAAFNSSYRVWNNYWTELTGGSETRPRNLALIYCMKY